MLSAHTRTTTARRLSIRLTALFYAVTVLAFVSVTGAHLTFAGCVGLLAPILLLLSFSRRDQSRKRQSSASRVLILGKNNIAGKLHEEITKGVREGRAESGQLSSGSYPTSADVEDAAQLREIILQEGISHVVIADSAVQAQEDLTSVLIECKFRGVQIQTAPDFYESVHKKVWLEALWPGWFLFSQGSQLPRRDQFFKRGFDLLCAVAAMVCLAPLMCLTALLVKLDSRGPVLYRQVRVGQYGTPFTLLKFRSMREDAEEETGPMWASVDDDRVTFLGKFLRKSHIDELPQIINVLRNDISFVGPRPERPAFVESLAKQIPFFQLRHYLKPGITGWAQVNLPYSDSVESSYDKLQYDLYYARNASFVMDMRILLLTIRQVLLRRGR